MITILYNNSDRKNIRRSLQWLIKLKYKYVLNRNVFKYIYLGVTEIDDFKTRLHKFHTPEHYCVLGHVVDSNIIGKVYVDDIVFIKKYPLNVFNKEFLTYINLKIENMTDPYEYSYISTGFRIAQYKISCVNNALELSKFTISRGI